MKLRIGTRGSDLARAQATWVASELEAGGAETELVIISTAGDRSQAPTFGSIGPQGVFVREIEQALLADRIDVAVHSYKDLPTQSPDALTVAAVPARADPADYLLVRRVESGTTVDSLTSLGGGSVVGTSSARRGAWIRHTNPALRIEPLRGNVPTRIGRLRSGDYDAIVLARAGIDRLPGDLIHPLLAGLQLIRLDPEAFVPAPAQGALALQCRRDDSAASDRLTALDDPGTRAAVTVEREVLAHAEGGCDAAFGAYCRTAPGGYALSVMAEIAGAIHTLEHAGAEPGPLAESAWHALEQRGGLN